MEDNWRVQIQKYIYLSIITIKDKRDAKEINARIGMARNAFNKLERVIKDKKMKC